MKEGRKHESLTQNIRIHEQSVITVARDERLRCKAPTFWKDATYHTVVILGTFSQEATHAHTSALF